MSLIMYACIFYNNNNNNNNNLIKIITNNIFIINILIIIMHNIYMHIMHISKYRHMHSIRLMHNLIIYIIKKHNIKNISLRNNVADMA